MKIKRKSKALTLVELIIVLALMTLVLGIVFNFFSFGNKIFSKGSKQYDLQSSIRLAADSITSEVRYSTKLDILNYPTDTIPSDRSTLSDNEGYIYYYYDTIAQAYFLKKITKLSETNYYIGKTTDSAVTFNRLDGNRTLFFDIIGKDNDNEYKVNSKVVGLNMQISGEMINDTSDAGGNAIHYYRRAADNLASLPAGETGETGGTGGTPPPNSITDSIKIYINNSKVVDYDLNNFTKIVEATMPGSYSFNKNKVTTVTSKVDNEKDVIINLDSVDNNFFIEIKITFADNTTNSYKASYEKNSWEIVKQ